MPATQSQLESLPSIDPATNKILSTYEKTSPLEITHLLTKARAAQKIWSTIPANDRRREIAALQKQILSARDILADAVVRESGKPRVEALFADVFVALDTAAHFASSGIDSIREERVSHHNIAAKAKSGTLYYEPLGVVAIISS